MWTDIPKGVDRLILTKLNKPDLLIGIVICKSWNRICQQLIWDLYKDNTNLSINYRKSCFTESRIAQSR